MSPFEFINSINYTKEDIMTEGSEAEYSAFMANKSLSYFPDTLFYANEMNVHWNLDNRFQYDFLRNSVRKRKRFSKWFKAEKNTDFEAVKEYFKYNDRNTRMAMKILSPEVIKNIKKALNTGGTK